MKKIIYTCSIVLLQAFSQQALAQADVQLSNLVSPTKVNVALLPDKDNKRDLGNFNKGWKDLYLRGIVWREGYTWVAGASYSLNTFVGQNAGSFMITTGESTSQQNTFVGTSAGFKDSTGIYNTFIG